MKTSYNFYKEPFALFIDFTDWDFGVGVGFGWDTEYHRPEFRLYLDPVYFSIDWL